MLTALDHVNLHTDDVEGLAGWYATVLGLKRGPRPDFSVPGIWMYLGDRPCVHVVKVDAAPQRTPASLEHFAFRAKGMAAFEAKLNSLGVPFRRVDLPNADIVQYNVHDPTGTHLHIDFSPSKERD